MNQILSKWLLSEKRSKFDLSKLKKIYHYNNSTKFMLSTQGSYIVKKKNVTNAFQRTWHLKKKLMDDEDG
jgi:hypothetical protein